MKRVLIVVGLLIGLVAIVATIGSFVPRHHTASVQASFAASPEAIYEVIADFERYPAWRAEVKSAVRLADVDGKTSYLETTDQGALTYVVELAEYPSRLVLRIADQDLPYGGTWTFAIAPDASGTVVSITESGEIKSAIFRALAHFFFGYHATIEQFQADLGAKLGLPVRTLRVR